MLPLMTPVNAIPVASQLDPVKPRPEIPPVAPVQPSSNESTVDLRNRDPEQAALLLREEQQRQQHQHEHPEERPPEENLAVPGDSLNADNTVPVVPLMDQQPRQGLWVDIEV